MPIDGAIVQPRRIVGLTVNGSRSDVELFGAVWQLRS